MITLTVKTLDAQNHTFEVEDDITVEQFKVHIADTVNVPAETQRIIYCGRVLQDSTKLSDYNVDGKVVHLVQRPPPGTNARSSTRAASPPPQTTRRVFMEPGNTMYLGSMPFPANLMESQGFVPPPPTHSLAGSRLNVARRMLRRAEAVIRVLENPSARPSDQTPPEEPQEEVTPVIEARVIVPSNSNEPIDEAMVLSAVHDTLLNATGTPSSNEDTTNDTQPNDSQNHSVSSTPETATPTRSSTENLATSGEQRQESSSSGNTFPENASRTSEMAELLTMLNNLQLRFAPFLERYHNFMIEDPVVAPEDVRQMQAMLTRVSGVLHFLGHAYHSLSDIIIRVRTPPPRPLLCRPILIQHSAVVQAGIPIQVEAQINLSTDRPGAQNETGNNNNAASNADSSAPSAPPTLPQDSAQPSVTSSTGPTIAAQIQPMMSFPFLPGTSMHVQYRSLPRMTGIQSSQNNNNNNAATTGTSGDTVTSSTSQPSQGTEPVTTSERTDTTNTATPRSAAGENTSNMYNNPNVEFFMEVTPEVLRGTMNAPPPELLQSLMQVAGQIIGRTTAPSSTVDSVPIQAAAADPPQVESLPQSDLLHSIVQMANHIIGNPNIANGPTVTITTTGSHTLIDGSQPLGLTSQNSQARVNAQTNLTTATHTRSTARPHVHLAQQAMQGGFDPFLPCNSHHLPPRRRFQVHTAQNIAASNASRNDQVPGQVGSAQGTGQNRSNFVNAVVDGLITSLRSGYGHPTVTISRPQSAPPTGTANSTTSSSTAAASAPRNETVITNVEDQNSGRNANSLGSLLRTVQTIQQSETDRQNDAPPADSVPTSTQNTGQEQRVHVSRLNSLMESHGVTRETVRLYEIIRMFTRCSAVNQSVTSDLILLLVESLTFGDAILLSSGDLTPFNRIRNQVASFVNENILQNSTGPAAVDRGVELVLADLRPFFELFSSLRTRDNIDMARSAEALFRSRLPNIISIASNLSQNNNVNQVRLLFDQCSTTMNQLCALALHCSANGERGVEEMLDLMVAQWLQGTHNFLPDLRQYMQNLSVPDSILQPYIVRRSDSRIPITVNGIADANTPQTTVPMEVDEQEEVFGSASEGSSAGEDDTEPLPNVVIGSQPWHNQLPPDWVPIITRDIHRQRRQSPQRPFSDAYLSGMPSKRRKLINSNKPQGSLSEVITDSVKQAVTATGLTSVAPLETVAQAAGSSPEVQTAYRSLLKTSVQEKLKNDKDFTPDRFPNASNYFNKN